MNFLKNSKLGMSAITVGMVLYGYCAGLGSRRHGSFHEFEIAKVGRDYVYDKYGTKYRLVLNKEIYPQYDTLIAQNEDPNCRYNYYKTQEGAERGLKASRLRIELSRNTFRSPSDDVIFKIAEILEIE